MADELNALGLVDGPPDPDPGIEPALGRKAEAAGDPGRVLGIDLQMPGQLLTGQRVAAYQSGIQVCDLLGRRHTHLLAGQEMSLRGELEKDLGLIVGNQRHCRLHHHSHDVRKTSGPPRVFVNELQLLSTVISALALGDVGSSGFQQPVALSPHFGGGRGNEGVALGPHFGGGLDRPLTSS